MNTDSIRHLTLAHRHATAAVGALLPASTRRHLDVIQHEFRALLVDILSERPAEAPSGGSTQPQSRRIDIEEA